MVILQGLKKHTTMKPIIALSAHFADDNNKLNEAYAQAIYKAGGSPLIIPVINDEAYLIRLLDLCDGLLLTGGGDIDPSFWGETLIPQSDQPNIERDHYDLILTREAARRQLPILGICRGHQIINVAFKGDIYQDIYTQIGQEKINPKGHSQKRPMTQTHHLVTIDPTSKLHDILGVEHLETNSLHHQAIRKVAPGFRVVARSDDGIIEGIEHTDYPILGVQWHPEHLMKAGEETAIKLFKAFIGQATLQAKAKALHLKYPIIDSHCDTPMEWYEGIDLGERQTKTQVDFVKMQEGLVDISCMVAYLPQKPWTKVNEMAALTQALTTYTQLKEQIQNHSTTVGQAYTSSDILRLKHEGKLGILFGLENGFALAQDIHNVKRLYDLGVRYITLCHNGDNPLCDSARSTQTHGGLSHFGTQVIHEMNRLGMLVDIAHASADTILQAIEESSKPIISSHSCARALCSHKRNLTDEALKALAQKGGVIQLCLYSGFLRDHGKADLSDVLRHLTHIIDLVGEDYVGIGSDFDGGGGIKGCQNVNELINITKVLFSAGYSSTTISKIMGGNFLRVLHEAEA